MEKADIYSKLIAAGVGKSYASEISSGKRSPSTRLAIRVYRATGLKVGPIANSPETEILALEKHFTRAA